jgi:hypothetical protein
MRRPRKTTSRSKRNIRKELVEQTGYESLLFADGLDAAIIGVADDTEPFRVVYSKDKIAQILMKQNKWSFDEANEYAHFNIYDAYVGERTPIYIGTIE